MTPDTHSALDAARELLAKRRRSLLYKLGIRSMPSGDPLDGTPIRRAEATLMWEGTLCWGALTMANYGIFSEGPDDLPGIVVADPANIFERSPASLLEVAQEVFSLKGRPFESIPGKLKPAAVCMQDELHGARWLPVPESIAGGRGLFLRDMMFRRHELPGGRLSAHLLPLLVNPGGTAYVRLLPEECWTEDLAAVVDGTPEDEVAPDFGRTAEINPRFQTPEEVVLDKNAERLSAAGTVVLSEAAKARFREDLQRQRGEDLTFVIACSPTQITRQYVPFDPAVHRRVPCDGLPVAVPHDSWDMTEGLYVDWLDDGETEQLVVRRAD